MVRNFDNHDKSWRAFWGTGPIAPGNFYAINLAHNFERRILFPSVHPIGSVLPNFSKNYGKYGKSWAPGRSGTRLISPQPKKIRDILGGQLGSIGLLFRLKNDHGQSILSIPVHRLDPGFDPPNRLMRHDADSYQNRGLHDRFVREGSLCEKNLGWPQD
jgi:hypothetical protein